MSTNTTPAGEPTEPTRWHPCELCDAPNDTFQDFWVVACDDCSPGLWAAINKTYEEYRAQRRQERP